MCTCFSNYNYLDSMDLVYCWHTWKCTAYNGSEKGTSLKEVHGKHPSIALKQGLNEADTREGIGKCGFW